MSQILPNNEPFFFSGGKIGCLLIHGLTGTPKEMRGMGEFLSSKGYTALGIRLPGHATKPEDLRHVTWHDWLASAEDGWTILSHACRQIYVIGLSLGGALSLLLASQKPVKGIITLSAPYQLPQPRLHPWMKILQFVVPYIPISVIGMSDWHDNEAEKTHICYSRTPTHSVVEVNDLLNKLRPVLPEIKAPILLIHSRKDGVLPVENLSNIYERIGSRDKQMLWVDNSGHNLPRDAERQRVYQSTHEFIQKVSQIDS